jgi:hypothetical protein
MAAHCHHDIPPIPEFDYNLLHNQQAPVRLPEFLAV